MQNTKRVPKGRTRFSKLFLAYPLPAVIGCGFIALGAATGISTSALLGVHGLAASPANTETPWVLPLFRMSAFNMLLTLAVLSAVYHKAALPFASAAFAVKGLVSGFGLRQLFFDFGWYTALPLAAGMLLFSLPAYTALFTAFAGWAAVQKAKTEEDRVKHERAYAATAASLFLALLGAIAEGLLYPALMRILVGQAV